MEAQETQAETLLETCKLSRHQSSPVLEEEDVGDKAVRYAETV